MMWAGFVVSYHTHIHTHVQCNDFINIIESERGDKVHTDVRVPDTTQEESSRVVSSPPRSQSR